MLRFRRNFQLLCSETLRPFSTPRMEDDQVLSGMSVGYYICLSVHVFLWMNLDVLHCLGTAIFSLGSELMLFQEKPTAGKKIIIHELSVERCL
ncbi:hypothetical protein CHARACLAT_023618 [Characodon lateralis]|uniref:Uncharacterized protein n=1 Tax=Characodon lateralis TaxID=208331 RepID=A0ABU7D9F8_9TELE|nr:hypothetical protein [Characodon lateralis]